MGIIFIAGELIFIVIFVKQDVYLYPKKFGLFYKRGVI